MKVVTSNSNKIQLLTLLSKPLLKQKPTNIYIIYIEGIFAVLMIVGIVSIFRKARYWFITGRSIHTKKETEMGIAIYFFGNLASANATNGSMRYRHIIIGIYHILPKVVWSKNSIVLKHLADKPLMFKVSKKLLPGLKKTINQ